MHTHPPFRRVTASRILSLTQEKATLLRPATGVGVQILTSWVISEIAIVFRTKMKPRDSFTHFLILGARAQDWMRRKPLDVDLT